MTQIWEHQITSTWSTRRNKHIHKSHTEHLTTRTLTPWQQDIGIARILFGGGVHFCHQKSWQPLLVLKRLFKYTSKSNPPSKNVLKIDSSSGWGVHLHIFPVNYAWKKNFTALGVQVHPLHPLATPMQQDEQDCNSSATEVKNSHRRMWKIHIDGCETSRCNKNRSVRT